MITLPRFRLHRPRSLAEALRILAEYRGDARVLAGGTDLLVNLRNRLATPSHVVALGCLRSLRDIRVADDGGLRVGALATVAELARHAAVNRAFPVLARAAASVAGPTIRAMGTVGGNLCLDTRCHWYNQDYFWRKACGFCLKKDGSVCHVAPGSNVCWAVYAGDLAPALLVLDAEAVILSVRGERVVPLNRFFIEDGLRKYDLAADEILTEVRVAASKAGLGGTYFKLRARGSIDYPLAGLAAAARIDSERRFLGAAAAVTAVGSRPFLIEGASEILDGVEADNVEAIERAAHLAWRLANPVKTGGAASPAYRRLRVGLFARDAFREISAQWPPPESRS